MDIRVLRYFLVVAREENITRAADLLHVTQPTLSRQIMQVEEELGVKLFTRSNHNIILTDDGMRLRQRAQEIVDLTDKTVREFTMSDNNLAGEITIGSGELHSVHYLAELLSQFHKMHPLVHFVLYSGQADHIKERMERGLIDVALLSEPVDMVRYDFMRLPETEEWGILIHEDSPLAKKESVTPQDLVGVPLIMPQRELIKSELSSWFGPYADQVEILMTINLQYNAAVLVKHRLGALVTIRLESQYENLHFIPLSPRLVFGSAIAWKRNQAHSATTTAFIEFIRKYKKSISSDKI
ncbi:MAG: LysR family transcriptional regulator [Christensenella sp.]|uniref:LysR family transcriptional regulator n=1 Tax=Christensenella sp. TaxID=1935934 RepID=UPI002B2010CA|nr:LysR family transcriptional regulator [Christensenella sp.]MEA5002496.1 LysR family transcriptional regulator [Christensenella sp.]